MAVGYCFLPTAYCPLPLVVIQQEPAMPLIELRNLFQIYGTKNNPAYILRDINLSVEQGEFVSIMGPSGSEKSTLLYLLGMLERPTSGEYLFDG